MNVGNTASGEIGIVFYLDVPMWQLGDADGKAVPLIPVAGSGG